MNKKLIITLLFALLAISAHAATIEEEDDVIVLTDDNFDEVINGNEFVLVEFYAPWCGHCKKLTPEYSAAAKILKGQEKVIPLGKMDATEHKKASGKFEVKGFPTLKFFNNGNAIDYNGGRTSDTIVAWINKRTGDVSKLLADQAAIDAFLGENKMAIIYFASETSGDKWDAFKATAMNYDKFGFAHVTDAALATANNSSIGKLALFKPFDEKRNDYEGEIKFEAITEFVDAAKLATVMEFDETAIEVVFQKQTPTVFIFNNDTEESLQARAIFDGVAQELKAGAVKFAYCTPENQHWQRLADYIGVNTAQVPAIMLVKASSEIEKFKFEKDITADNLKQFLEDYNSGNLSQHIKSEDIPEDNSKPVKVIVGKNFEDLVLKSPKDVLVKFYAPWCGHCKTLIPAWEEAAEKLAAVNPNIVIAKCDATANEIPNVEIKGYPTLRFFPGNNKSKVGEFDGDRSAEGIISWLKENTTHPWVEIGASEATTETKEEPKKDDL